MSVFVQRSRIMCFLSSGRDITAVLSLRLNTAIAVSPLASFLSQTRKPSRSADRGRVVAQRILIHRDDLIVRDKVALEVSHFVERHAELQGRREERVERVGGELLVVGEMPRPLVYLRHAYREHIEIVEVTGRCFPAPCVDRVHTAEEVRQSSRVSSFARHEQQFSFRNS